MKEHVANILTHGVSNYVQHWSVPGLRIRTHLVRIQHFRLNTEPIRIQSGSRVLMTKNWRIYSWKKKIKNVQVTEAEKKPSELKKEHSALQNMKFLNFYYFCGSFLPFWIRIQFGSGSGSATLITSHHCVLTPPPPLGAAKAGGNIWTSKIPFFLHTGIGKRYSQTISVICLATALRRCNLPS